MLRSIQATGRHAIIRNSTKRCYKTSSMPVSTVAQLLKSNAPASSASQDGLVTVNGFVRTVRKQKRVAFAAIGDGTTVEAVQCVLTPEQAKEYALQDPAPGPDSCCACANQCACACIVCLQGQLCESRGNGRRVPQAKSRATRCWRKRWIS